VNTADGETTLLLVNSVTANSEGVVIDPAVTLSSVAARRFLLLGVGALAAYLVAGVFFTLNVQLIGVGKAERWNKPYVESYAYHAVWVLV
jgi:hypothetical protein